MVCVCVQFLQSNPDVFVLLLNGSRVALRNPAETPEQGAGPKSVAESAQDGSEAGSDSGLEAEPVSGHWFDLNDSTVTVIRESDIIKQYEGKESAYMLFYRKHTLQRPCHGVCVCVFLENSFTNLYSELFCLIF